MWTLVSGNVWFDQTDVRVPGVGTGSSFVRSYNSALPWISVGGAFGRGWNHSYEANLSFLPANIIKLRQGNEAAREAVVLELYRRGIGSSGKAAELLGMQRFDFVRYADKLGIPFFRMSKEEWEAERAAADSL